MWGVRHRYFEASQRIGLFQLVTAMSLFESLDEGSQQSSGSILAGFKVFSRLFVKVSKTPRQTHEIPQLSDRAEGNYQETHIIFLCFSGASLDDIRRNRNSTSPHLAGQTILFGRRKGLCRPINGDGEFIGESKCVKFSVVSQASSPKPGLTEW